ncbi:MAG TPA: hypothetical protein VLM85_29455, partial [Polyangiaceae bacterium]|nr:hypothetical protein [Polyangiaceae bacterium]
EADDGVERLDEGKRGRAEDFDAVILHRWHRTSLSSLVEQQKGVRCPHAGFMSIGSHIDFRFPGSQDLGSKQAP